MYAWYNLLIIREHQLIKCSEQNNSELRIFENVNKLNYNSF